MSNEVVLRERLRKIIDPITSVLVGVPGDVIPRSVYDNVKKHNAKFLKPKKAEPVKKDDEKAEKAENKAPKKRGRPKKEYRPDDDTTIVHLD